jgi:hypothetical protein
MIADDDVESTDIVGKIGSGSKRSSVQAETGDTHVC